MAETEELKTISAEELTLPAMQIIMKAGDARNIMAEAVNEAKKGHFEVADLKALDAKECIREAHVLHTQIISKEAAGEIRIIPTLLFNHAQDTLMTINTEVNLYLDMIDLLKMIYKGANNG